jgi:hypothetical protein
MLPAQNASDWPAVVRATYVRRTTPELGNHLAPELGNHLTLELGNQLTPEYATGESAGPTVFYSGEYT